MMGFGSLACSMRSAVDRGCPLPDLVVFLAVVFSM